MSAGGPVDEGVPLGHSGEPESIALCDHYRHFDVKVVKVVVRKGRKKLDFKTLF